MTFRENAPEDPPGAPPGRSSQLQAAPRLEYELTTDPASRRASLRIGLPPGLRARRVAVRAEGRTLAGAELAQSTGDGIAVSGTVVVTLAGAALPRAPSAGLELEAGRPLGRARSLLKAGAQAQLDCDPLLQLNGATLAFDACVTVGLRKEFNVYATLVPGAPPASGNASVRFGLRAANAFAGDGEGGWASAALPEYPGLMALARAGVVKAAPVAAGASAAGGRVTVKGYLLPGWSYFSADVEHQRGTLDVGAAAEAEVDADGERSVQSGHSRHSSGLSGGSRGSRVSEGEGAVPPCGDGTAGPAGGEVLSHSSWETLARTPAPPLAAGTLRAAFFLQLLQTVAEAASPPLEFIWASGPLSYTGSGAMGSHNSYGRGKIT